MSAIGRISQVGGAQPFGVAMSGPVPQDGAAEPSRALVLVRPVERTEPLGERARRPSAAYVAHLIATHRQEPQTRARRRLEPAEAVVRYAEGGRVPPGANGLLLSRAV